MRSFEVQSVVKRGGRSPPVALHRAVRRESGEPVQCGARYDTAGAAIQPSENTRVPDTEFKPGDTVSLKSGGPRMTIAMIDRQSAFCEWFGEDPQPQSRSFALASLKLDGGE